MVEESRSIHPPPSHCHVPSPQEWPCDNGFPGWEIASSWFWDVQLVDWGQHASCGMLDFEVYTRAFCYGIINCTHEVERTKAGDALHKAVIPTALVLSFLHCTVSYARLLSLMPSLPKSIDKLHQPFFPGPSGGAVCSILLSVSSELHELLVTYCLAGHVQPAMYCLNLVLVIYCALKDYYLE